ncbi:MAG: multicopper oxidase family protein [Deltaproteobacteria bacterium]|nr:multicopper oxidase family protein [Deltaproteobacteria bacterium]
MFSKSSPSASSSPARASLVMLVFVYACQCRPATTPEVRSFIEPALLADEDITEGRFVGTLQASATTLDRTGTPTEFLTFNGGIPGPQIRVRQGDEVSIRFLNGLPDGHDWSSGVHWHGIEGYNASDGTPLTEVGILPGAETTYTFRATRPGVYWYHPHIRGAQAIFSGLYGPLIVVDPAEDELIARGVLPTDDRVLVLSDTWTSQGIVTSAESTNAMEIMNGTEGRELLVNGHLLPTLEVVAGSAVRLRLINSSITRFWRVSVPGHTLIRVGGEGGLLNHARVEGGSVTGERFDIETGASLGPAEVSLGYERGEVLLAPGERADVVLITDGVVGDEWPLRWEDSPRGRHEMWMEDGEMVMGDAADDGTRPGVEVARFRLVAGEEAPITLADGTPLLAAVGRSIDPVATPANAQWFDEAGTTLDEEMTHEEDENGEQVMTTWFGMNGVSWHPDHMAGPEQPMAPSAKSARIGDTIEWEVRNNSMMAHPYHLHGFSYQPYALVFWPDPDHATADNSAVRVPWSHDEFEDTTLIPPFASLYFRVHLSDPAGDGSAAGRWVQHCHILQHGENGMMSELVVSP